MAQRCRGAPVTLEGALEYLVAHDYAPLAFGVVNVELIVSAFRQNMFIADRYPPCRFPGDPISILPDRGTADASRKIAALSPFIEGRLDVF